MVKPKIVDVCTLLEIKVIRTFDKGFSTIFNRKYVTFENIYYISSLQIYTSNVTCKCPLLRIPCMSSDIITALTKEEVMGQSLLLLIAGFETTSSTICFLLYHLACNPACQEKARREVDEILGDKVGDNRDHNEIAILLHEGTSPCCYKFGYQSHLFKERNKC